MIYLDNNASTKMDPGVREAMERAFDLFGNPSSVHGEGRRARQAVEEARDEVASLIGASPDEVVFTSGGTEANALAIFSAADNGCRVVITAVEHPSVRAASLRLAVTSAMTVVDVAPSFDGTLDADRLLDAVLPRTKLVCVMAASNEYGGLFPVEAIAPRARARGALVHTDAVQAAGRVPIDVTRVGRGHPVPFGAQAARAQGRRSALRAPGLAVEPLAPGGGQERRRRAGTENTASIVGFGVAARLARHAAASRGAAVAARRDALETRPPGRGSRGARDRRGRPQAVATRRRSSSRASRGRPF